MPGGIWRRQYRRGRKGQSLEREPISSGYSIHIYPKAQRQRTANRHRHGVQFGLGRPSIQAAGPGRTRPAARRIPLHQTGCFAARLSFARR